MPYTAPCRDIAVQIGYMQTVYCGLSDFRLFFEATFI